MARAVVKLVPAAVPRAQARNATKMSVPGARVPVHEDSACLEAEVPVRHGVVGLLLGRGLDRAAENGVYGPSGGDKRNKRASRINGNKLF